MALVFYSVVRRHMKRTTGFTLVDERNPLPFELALAEGETAVGWYRNPPTHEDSVLVFTSEAIWIGDMGVFERIPIDEILDFENIKRKEGLEGLWVETTKGRRYMRASGSYGPGGTFKDWAALMMILNVVRSRGR